MSILETRRVLWADEAGCAASAAALACRMASDDAVLADAFIELDGPLGAGKTTFARHLLRALGVRGAIKSPTYAVMEAYDGLALGTSPRAIDISHFDFYRFNDPQEWEDAGFRDVFARPGLKLAEWPEKAAGLLPLADLRIEIEPGSADEPAERRRVTFSARTARGAALLA